MRLQGESSTGLRDAATRQGSQSATETLKHKGTGEKQYTCHCFIPHVQPAAGCAQPKKGCRNQTVHMFY